MMDDEEGLLTEDEHELKKDEDDEEEGGLERPVTNAPVVKVKPTTTEKIKRWASDRGHLSCLVALAFMFGGLILFKLTFQGSAARSLSEYLLSLGLFAFSGGFTNWVAIQMLFKKVPFLYGSGVVPHRFREIRETVKDIILDTFFEESFLDKYANDKVSGFQEHMDPKKLVVTMMESPSVDNIIDEKLGKLAEVPQGQFLVGMGVDPKSLKPMVKPFVLGVGEELAGPLMARLKSGDFFTISRMQREVDIYLSLKVKDITEGVVTELMEDLLLEHLGYLVVWGTVFGGILGLLSQAAGLAPNYSGA